MYIPATYSYIYINTVYMILCKNYGAHVQNCKLHYKVYIIYYII